MMFFIVVFFYFGGIIFLYLVVSVNNIECVIMLIWYGVDYNVVDEYGRISLYIAVQKLLEECVYVYLDNVIWKDILLLFVKDIGFYFLIKIFSYLWVM